MCGLPESFSVKFLMLMQLFISWPVSKDFYETQGDLSDKEFLF